MLVLPGEHLLLLILILACTLTTEARKLNPNDAYFWTWDHNSYAIRNGNKGEEVVTFNDCAGLCAADGFDMLDIADEDEFDMLNEEMVHDRVSTFWTSGSLDSVDRSFLWRTNDEPISSFFWASGEPNHISGVRVCVEYKWDPESRFHKLFSISPCTGYRTCMCKKSASAPPQPNKPFQCKSEGMFPDPKVCNAFHQCVKNDANYRDFKMPCGPGTVYCEKLKVCGWERDCPCNGRIIE